MLWLVFALQNPNLVSVSGNVFGDAGSPVPRFQISFARVDEPATPPINVTAAGTFTAPLPPGQYRVTSSGLPPGFGIKSMTFGAADILTQPMTVTNGDTKTMTVTLSIASPPPWVSVSGRVTADGATQARVIRVTMRSPAAAEPLTTIVDADGSFEFSKVIPGSYTTLAFAATSLSPPLNVTVGATDVTGVTIRLPQSKTIAGHITVQGSLPKNIRVPRLAFLLAPLAGIPTSSASVPVNAEPDGSFKVALPPGERGLSVVAGTVPPGYKLASFTYGTTDLLKNPIRISPSDTAELHVMLDATAITPVNVSGRVADLLTTKGVRVVLTNPVFGSIEAPLSSDGSFAFSKVLPGNYIARLSLSGLAAGKQIAVADRDLTDVLITYPRRFIVAAHVIVENAAAASPGIVLEAKPTGGGGSGDSTINVNNVIMMNLKDRKYNVSVRNIPAGFQLKSIMYGTTDLQKAPLKIDGPVTWEIIVRLVAAPK
jgi:hypothetical protein